VREGGRDGWPARGTIENLFFFLAGLLGAIFVVKNRTLYKSHKRRSFTRGEKREATDWHTGSSTKKKVSAFFF
jgi:hypothetical protein